MTTFLEFLQQLCNSSEFSSPQIEIENDSMFHLGNKYIMRNYLLKTTAED